MDVVEDRLEALAEAAAALAGEVDLDDVLQAITRAAARLTGARYAALGVIAPSGKSLVRFITEGADPQTVSAIGHLPTGKGLLGLLIRDPRILRLDDLHDHPASSGFPPNHPTMTTFLGAPVRSGGLVYGNIYLTEKDGGFTPEDERLILVLSAQAGAAVENALLSAKLQSLAVQEERDRISRELHDNVIQQLFSIGMSLESARTLVHSDPQRVDDRLDAAVTGLDGTIRELRNAIFQLRPSDAASFGLLRGIIELAREHEVNTLTRPHLSLEAAIDERVPEALVPDVLQVVREALTNIARHARATNVQVAATLGADGLHLAVVDDGVGFDVSEASAGHGLVNIGERVKALGGLLDLHSAAGEGTRVEIDVPLLQGEQDA